MRPRGRLGTDRLLVGAYSASSQRKAEQDLQEGFQDHFIGQLRLDSLLARVVVIPDTYLLDGRFFASIEPEKLSYEVGRGISSRSLPIEVCSRSQAGDGVRLVDSLRQLLVRVDRETLNGFPFNSIPDAAARAELAAELSGTPRLELERHFGGCEDGEVPALLTDFLKRRVGSRRAHDALDAQREGWIRWIEAERRGMLKVSPWKGGFDIAGALRGKPLPRGVLQTRLGNSVHQHIVNEILASSRHKSDIASYLARVRADYGIERSESRTGEHQDLEILDAWHSMGRHLAFGYQHNADVASTFSLAMSKIDDVGRAVGRIESGIEAPDFILPDLVSQGLVVMNGEDFGRFTVEAKDRLSTIWDRGESSHVNELFSDLARRLFGQKLAVRRLETIGALGIFAGAAGGAATLLGAGVVSSAVTATLAGVATAEAAPIFVRTRKERGVVRRLMHFLSSRRVA